MAEVVHDGQTFQSLVNISFPKIVDGGGGVAGRGVAEGGGRCEKTISKNIFENVFRKFFYHFSQTFELIYRNLYNFQ